MKSATSTCTLPPLSDLLATPIPTTTRKSSALDVHNLLSPISSPTSCQHHHATFRPPYNNMQTPLKAKRKRASPSQLSVLNHVFDQTYFPSTELRIELGKQLSMSPRAVQIWFQNKRQSLRSRERQQQQQQQQQDKKQELSHSYLARTHLPPISPPLSPPEQYSWQLRPDTIALPPLQMPPCVPSHQPSYPSPTSIDAIILN
ncbi:hypothetical protein BX666DRAFT_1848723 [Dichotomocladium elegans]|nr:hypothetical protein BX666DRAFT_1848723 [Dichotomocladium elegans]